MKSRLPVLIASLAASVATGCSDSVSPRVSSVVLRMPADSVFFGRTMRMVAVATGDTDIVAHPSFTWTSSDTTVLIVDTAGVVLGTGSGSAYIISELEGKRDSLLVRGVLREPLPSERFTLLSEGNAGICALATTGRVYCARGSIVVDPPFELMPGGENIEFRSLYATLHSNCGFAADSTYWCWGSNGHRHFANGMSAGFTTTDQPVQGGGGRKFLSLTIGGHSHVCGANAADSVVYCVGHNDGDQLGRDNKPLEDGQLAPVLGGLKARGFGTSEFTVCALDFNDAAHCWGGFTPFGSPAPFAPGRTFKSVSGGSEHMCALGTDDRAWCWGNRTFGQTGPGATDANTVNLVSGEISFAMVRAHRIGSCGLTPQGALWCWGDFVPHALADRYGSVDGTPARILHSMALKDLAATWEAACGITTDGRLVCW